MKPGGQHIVIVGGGIAGLGTAWELQQSQRVRVTVLEGEPAIFSRASGMNAGIFRPLERDPLLVELAAQSLRQLAALERATEGSLLRSTGLLMLGPNRAELEQLARHAAEFGFATQLWTSREIGHGVQGLQVAPGISGAFCPRAGVLDVHEIGQVLLRACTRSGVTVRTGEPVARLTIGGQGQCTGVELASGERLLSDAVVLCAGAQAGQLSLEAGAPLPLVPLRRQLAVLDAERGLARDAPVVWQTHPELYFRPESGGVLVSPCDETPVHSPTPKADVGALHPLAERLAAVHPGLAEARVRRVWACVRTKAPDNRPIIGQAPYVSGLYYLVGLGGFGMSCGLGAAAWLAECLLEGKSRAPVAPRRFYLPFFAGASSSSTRSAGV